MQFSSYCWPQNEMFQVSSKNKLYISQLLVTIRVRKYKYLYSYINLIVLIILSIIYIK